MSEKIQGLEVEVSVLFKNKGFLKSLDDIQKKLDQTVTSIKDFEKAGTKSFGSLEKKIDNSVKKISKSMKKAIKEATESIETSYKKSFQQTIKMAEEAMNKYGELTERVLNTNSSSKNKHKTKKGNKRRTIDTNAIQSTTAQENTGAASNASSDTAENEEEKTTGYLKSFKILKDSVDDFDSETFSKMLTPLSNMTEIIDNVKGLGDAIKEITTTNGKFDLGKTLKFGAISAGLYLVNSLFETFTDYLKNNETAQASWNAIVENGKSILSGIADVITTVIAVLFGFNKETNGTYQNNEKLNGILDNVKNTTENLKEKIAQLKEWVANNKDTIAEWGEKLKEVLPYIIGFFIIIELIKIITTLSTVITAVKSAVLAVDVAMKFMASTNPMVLIVMLIVGAIIALILYLKHLYDTNEGFRAVVDNAWNAIKNVIDSAIEGCLISFDAFKYALGELGKAWEAFKNGDFKSVKTHLSNVTNKENRDLYIKNGIEERKAKKALAEQTQKNADNIQKNTPEQLKNLNPESLNGIYNGNPKAQEELKKAEALKEQITKEWLDNWNSFIESQSTTIAALTQEWVNFFTSLQILVITSVALMSLPWIMFITSLNTSFSTVILSLSTFWIIFVTNSIASLGLLSSTTILIVEIMKFKILELVNIMALATMAITSNLILLTASLVPVLITSQSVIDGIKFKLSELITSFNNVILKVQETINKIKELRTAASFGVTINSTVNSSGAVKTKENYMGTNHFSGGLTTINEHGDELLLAPNGTVIANNPSTTNIMRDLFSLKSSMSQLNFKINGNSGERATNNITVNIGNVSNRNDVDYLLDQLSMLDLS